MSESSLRHPPRGWKAFFWRAPIFFYHVNLGWLLGKRLLLLNHIGRKSGQPRQAVLEVVHHTPDAYYVASGFGEKSHWFQNIMHTPQVNIQVGRRKTSATAERLPFPEAKEILKAYAQAHPFALRELSRVIGLSYDGSEADLEKLANLLPIVKFLIH
jgi:deazaflavin-dependent oxidoreductase (nitroreductase family)